MHFALNAAWICAPPAAGRPANRASTGRAATASRASQVPMKARVTVTLKSCVLDPQGKAIEGALKTLGVKGGSSVRQGKVFDIEIKAKDPKAATAALKAAADKLVANTVIE